MPVNMKENPYTIIESLGVYLPPDSITTGEVLEGCRNELRFPLERITGIKTRHMAGRSEFAADLAREAIADCLSRSKYLPPDIDLLICCNISRVDGADWLSYEPATSSRLKKHFGFSNALVFDISNACAGMFTGIFIADALLKSGAIRRGMVVSGEYITHLARTAQREIEGYMDSRLACLTLGDAGAAVILETGPDQDTGLQKIELQTFGRYSPFCVGKQAESGGWIMYTDSVNLTDAAIKAGAEYSLSILREAGWPPDSFQHLIMHQTSTMSLNSARNEINRLLKKDVCHQGNTINNLAQRGNTASTSHFIALADQIRENRINSGDRIVFSVSASGLTVGAALYVLDDLPDRFRRPTSAKSSPSREDSGKYQPPAVSGIRIESVGTLPVNQADKKDALGLAHLAAEQCLRGSSYQRDEMELLIYAGVYRDEYVMEPAFATLLAGKLDMNATLSGAENKKTLAFDVFNGSVGLLNACHLAQQLIAGGKYKTAMVAAAEIENNAGLFPDSLQGLRETASALILDAHPVRGKGFSRILFNYDTGSLDAYVSHCCTVDDKPFLRVEKSPGLEDRYIACIQPLVEDLLRQEGLTRSRIGKVFPPQISSAFIARLSEALDIPAEKFVDIAGDGPDYFTSSFPYALAYARGKGLVQEGDTGLVIAAGSGIQAGCALYHF